MIRIVAASIALLLATLTPAAQAAAFEAAAAETKYEQDRRLILAMAGNYKVRFDLRETTAWDPAYTPIKPVLSGGNEVVRVIEDTGRVIRLQHLLVVEHGGEAIVVKHWRQDWTFEPATLLVYSGEGHWKVEPVPEAERRGRWSQTVWQTDDSPRYGGIGAWIVQGGVPQWQSDPSWRPLARRDAVRKPPYDRYLAVNRHAPTPAGWIHWQDNIKMALKDGRPVPVVQEIGLNSYERFDDYAVKAAEDYWARTAGYWAQVRAMWDARIAAGGGVAVAEVADTGSAGAERLMGFADQIAEGRLAADAATRQARGVIDEVTGGASGLARLAQQNAR